MLTGGAQVVVSNPPEKFAIWAGTYVAEALVGALDFESDADCHWFNRLVAKANAGTGPGTMSWRHDRSPFVQRICRDYYEARSA